MAENHDKIEVQETSGGESADGLAKWNPSLWKFDKTTVVSEFLTESSLHGLKYVGQPKRHIAERVFWIVTFIVGVAAAGYLIHGVFSRYEETPVIVSFQSKEQSVDTIPFPAVTFCYNHQLRIVVYNENRLHFVVYEGESGVLEEKEKAQFEKKIFTTLINLDLLLLKRDGLKEGEPEYNAISKKLEMIDSICESRKSFFRAYFGSFFSYLTIRDDYYYLKNQSKLQQEIIDLLLEFTPSCEDMIPFAMLDGSKISRDHILHPVITEHGKCCTFNMLPTPLMLKQPSVGNENAEDIFGNPVLGTKSKWEQRDINNWQQWNYEKGSLLFSDSYKTETSRWRAEKNSHPFRNQRLGYSFGLSVVINTFEPYCDEITFHGTTFMLHNPLDIPRVSQFPTVIGSKQEVFIKIHPDITIADSDIKDLKARKRQCLFGKEQMLKYFRPYTQENCFEDCIANLIEKECGCSRFYMPRPNETVLCELNSKTREGRCVSETLVFLSKKEICGHCLPLCEYINYNFEMSTAKILNWHNSTFRKIPGMEYGWANEFNRDPDDIYQNISIVHIFYDSPSTVPKLRKRLYGTTDLIANTGGVLGLCLGFSVLSVAEFLYYVLMRTIWQMLSRRCLWCNTKPASAFGTSATMELKNLAKSNYPGSDKKSKFKRTKEFCKYCCKKRSILFRFKWLCCIFVGLVVSGSLIYMLVIKEENVKTQDTFNAPTSINEDSETYWAEATFCYVHQFSMEKVQELTRAVESTTDENHRHSAQTNLSIIEAMCEYKDALETSNSSTFPPLNPDVANYTYLMKFLEENTISCSQMFPGCVYMGMDQENCSKIIKPVDTIHGRCCRVRMAPAKTNPYVDKMANITAQPNLVLNSTSAGNPNNKVENSSLFSGNKFNSSYFVIEGATLSEEFSTYVQPFHFSVLLNLNQDPYICDKSTASTNQILFSLSSPGKFPETQDFSQLIAANEEVVLTLFPEAVSPTSPEQVMNNENRECLPYWWWDQDNYYTTKAALMDACSREFVSENCKCALFGYKSEFSLPLETSTCKTGSNSNDTICLKKMNELARKRKHICLCSGAYCPLYYCSGTAYSYIKTNQPMKNASKLWASLNKFGNNTTLDIPWTNNKTGIIHFTLDTSGQTKSSNNANSRGFSAIILITVMSVLICLSIIVFPHLWRCICGMIVKCTLYFRGVLHARKISALNDNDKP